MAIGGGSSMLAARFAFPVGVVAGPEAGIAAQVGYSTAFSTVANYVLDTATDHFEPAERIFGNWL